MTAFHGAKLALLARGRVLVLQRDDVPGIPFPGHWDLPGGGREGDETPEACIRRETLEELGFAPDTARIGWRRAYPGADGRVAWFFVLRDERFDEGVVRLGDEGQGWALMPVAEFLGHPLAVPHLAQRLGEYLAAR
jgi:8-oxo-dGTP diphosphatase